MLHVREPRRIAGGLQEELVFENFQFFSGSVESVGIGYFLGSGCGLGGCGGLGGAGKVVHCRGWRVNPVSVENEP